MTRYLHSNSFRHAGPDHGPTCSSSEVMKYLVMPGQGETSAFWTGKIADAEYYIIPLLSSSMSA